MPTRIVDSLVSSLPKQRGENTEMMDRLLKGGTRRVILQTFGHPSSVYSDRLYSIAKDTQYNEIVYRPYISEFVRQYVNVNDASVYITPLLNIRITHETCECYVTFAARRLCNIRPRDHVACKRRFRTWSRSL